MRIKNFSRFVNENLNPHSISDDMIDVKSRQGEPIFFDKDEFEDEEWQPTGDKPRKQKPDINSESDEEDFDYEDYYPDEEKEETEDEDEDDDSDFEDDLNPKGPDNEPFISDTDDDTEESDRDYIY